MEGQDLGGRSFNRPGSLLQTELVGVMPRQEGYSLANAAGGYQGAPHLCMPSSRHSALVGGLQHRRLPAELEQGWHADGRTRIVGPAHTHQMDRRRHVHGSAPHVYQNRVTLNSSLGGSQHMFQRSSRAIAPQTATCISRSPGGNVSMLAGTSGPYGMPLSFQSEAPNSMLRQGGSISAMPRPIGVPGPAMCNTYQHFQEQSGGDHGRLLDSIQMQSMKVHVPASTHVQAAPNTVSFVEVSGAPLVSKTLNQSNIPYNSAVLVPDDKGVYQLVNVDKKNAHQELRTVSFAESQRPVFHGSRHHNGDYSQGNPRHARALSLEMRDSQKNVAWEAHMPSHRNHLQQKSANHRPYHHQVQSNPGMGFKLYPRDDTRGTTVPICIDSDSQDDASIPPPTPPARRKEDVIEMEVEDTCEPTSNSPAPSPAAVEFADQSLSEEDLVLAARSLRELANTVPCAKVSDDPNNEDEEKKYEEFGFEGEEKKTGKGQWNPLDLLLDAAARMEDEVLGEKCRAGKRSCVPVAESSTRIKSKRMRELGYRKSYVYSAVLNHTYHMLSKEPHCFQTYNGLRGVTSTKSGKFIARCRYRGSAVQIGVFNSARDASKAYDRFMLALRGPMANTNHSPQDYLEFEVSNARIAFEQMCGNVRECPRTRKGSWRKWLEEAKRFRLGENKPSTTEGPEAFYSQVMNMEAILSQLESSNPEAFQKALERVCGDNEEPQMCDMLLQNASQPWSLLKHIGEKRLSLEDALSSLENRVEENCKSVADSSPSDCILCTADMLMAMESVWKAWEGGSFLWPAPGDDKLDSSGSRGCKQRGRLLYNNLSKSNEACKDRSNRSRHALAGLASRSTKIRGVLFPKGSEEDTPKRSKFLHHLRNDIHSHLEDTHLDDGDNFSTKKSAEALDLREESDVSSKPSSWNDLRVEDRDAKRPVIISGGRVRGCRPAPRRGTGRKAPSGRNQGNHNTPAHPSGAEFDRGRKGIRKRKSVYGHRTSSKKECTNQRHRQAGSSSDNTAKNWGSKGNQFSEENMEGITGSRSEGSRDSMVHVNVSEVQLTAEGAVRNGHLSQSAENRIIPCSAQLESDAESLDGRDYNGVTHVEDIQYSFGARSINPDCGLEQGTMETTFDDLGKVEGNTAVIHDGDQSATFAANKQHNCQSVPAHTEEGMVRIYGSQLSVQQLHDPDGEDAKNMSSMIKQEPANQLTAKRDVSMVDSVQWARLLASALWPKKRGGGMLHKAFNPNCSGLRYREVMLDLRKKMYENGSQEEL